VQLTTSPGVARPVSAQVSGRIHEKPLSKQMLMKPHDELHALLRGSNQAEVHKGGSAIRRNVLGQIINKLGPAETTDPLLSR